MAAADLCVGLIIPFNAYREETGVMFESMLARKSFCKIITFMEVVLICASIYHLLALSMERLYVIKNAVNCRKVKLSTKTVCMTVLLCWLIALVPAAPLLTEWDRFNREGFLKNSERKTFSLCRSSPLLTSVTRRMPIT